MSPFRPSVAGAALALVALTGCIPSLGGKGSSHEAGNERDGFTLRFHPDNGRPYRYHYATETRIERYPRGGTEAEERRLEVELVHVARDPAMGEHKWVSMQFFSPRFATTSRRALPDAATLDRAGFHYALYEDGQIGEIEGVLELQPYRFGLPPETMIRATYFPSPPQPVRPGGSWKSPVSFSHWNLGLRYETDLVYDFTLQGWAEPGSKDLLRVDYRARYEQRTSGRRRSLEGSGTIEGTYLYHPDRAVVTRHSYRLAGRSLGTVGSARVDERVSKSGELRLVDGDAVAQRP
jgi:hypothetical protein